MARSVAFGTLVRPRANNLKSAPPYKNPADAHCHFLLPALRSSFLLLLSILRLFLLLILPPLSLRRLPKRIFLCFFLIPFFLHCFFSFSDYSYSPPHPSLFFSLSTLRHPILPPPLLVPPPPFLCFLLLFPFSSCKRMR